MNYNTIIVSLLMIHCYMQGSGWVSGPIINENRPLIPSYQNVRSSYNYRGGNSRLYDQPSVKKAVKKNAEEEKQRKKERKKSEHYYRVRRQKASLKDWEERFRVA